MSKYTIQSITSPDAASSKNDKLPVELGLIDTAHPANSKLVIPAQPQHIYALVNAQTGKIAKTQKLVRKDQSLQVAVDGVEVMELHGFFANDNTVESSASPQTAVLASSASYAVLVNDTDLGLVSASTPPALVHGQDHIIWAPDLAPDLSSSQASQLAMLQTQQFGPVVMAEAGGLSALQTGLAALGATALASGGGASGSGGNSASPIAPSIATGAMLKGSVYAGPITSNGDGELWVQAFDNQGNSLGKAQVANDGSYTLTLNRAYSGAMLLKVYDADTTNSQTAMYVDEATGLNKSLTSLLAVMNIQDSIGSATVNITTLTNLAAFKAGASDASNGVGVPSAQDIETANTLIAQTFLGTDNLLSAEVLTSVSTNGQQVSTVNAYGIALNLLSWIETNTNQNTDTVAKNLASQIDSQGIQTQAAQALQLAMQSAIDRGQFSKDDASHINAVLNSTLPPSAQPGDNTPPADTTPPLAPMLGLSHDSGNDQNDGVTNTPGVEVSKLEFNVDPKSLEISANWQYKVDDGEWITGSGSRFDLTDGSHIYYVRQTDKAGNTSPVSSYQFTLDTTAAAPSLSLQSDSGVSASDGITNNKVVNVKGLEDGATWQYQPVYVGDPLIDNQWINGKGSSFELIDDTMTYYVRQTDKAGNTSTASSGYTFKLDTTAAAPSLSLQSDSGVSASDGITNNKVVKVNLLEADASWQYKVDEGEWITGSGSRFYLTDGSHTYYVRQTDKAGNTSPVSSYQFTLDQSPPQISPLSFSGTSLSFTASSDVYASSIQIFDGEIDVTQAFTIELTNGTFRATSQNPLSNGTHDLTVKLRDEAGNAQTSQTLQLIITDNVIHSFTQIPDTDATTPNAFVQGFKVLSGDQTKISINSIDITDLSVYFDITTQDGHDIYMAKTSQFTGNEVVTANLLDGNGASLLSDIPLSPIDTTSPSAAPSLSLQEDSGVSASDGITNNKVVNVNSLEAGATWQYKVDESEWITGSGSRFDLTDGSHSYYVHQTDKAGNTSPASSYKFTLDTTAPATAPTLRLESDSGISNTDGITNNPLVHVDSTNEELGSKLQYRVDGISAWINIQQSIFYLWEDGKAHVYQVREIDSAGNIGPISIGYNFTRDTIAAPSLSLQEDSGDSASDGITNKQVVNVNDLEDGASWQYKVVNKDDASDSTSWLTGTGSSFELSDGSNIYYVRQTDKAGNTSPASSYQFTLDTTTAAPSLSLEQDTGTPNDGVTAFKTVNVNGIETGATWQYQIDGDGTWHNGIGTTFDLESGTHNYLVRQTDLAGNEAVSALVHFTLDTTSSIATPSLKLEKDTGIYNSDGVTNYDVALIQNLAEGATWQYKIDGANDWTNGEDKGLTLIDGSHTYHVRQIKGELVSDEWTKKFTLDTQAPNPLLFLGTRDFDGSYSSKGNLKSGNNNIELTGFEDDATLWVTTPDEPEWHQSKVHILTVYLDTGSDYQTFHYEFKQMDIAGNYSAVSTANIYY